jgi:nucleoside diphosphate kinase
LKFNYFQLYLKPDFDKLIQFMTSDDSCILALTKENENNNDNIINDWRKDLNGDAENSVESLRAIYATNEIMNGIHGSDSHEAAIKFDLIF